MKKAILLFLIFISLFGCEKPKTNQESKQDTKKFEQVSDNLFNEDIYLLSIKYNIPDSILKEIIGEYEKMVQGYSFRSLFSEERAKTEKFDLSKTISVQEAIKRLSNQYQVQDVVLANILIDKKSMEKYSSE